MKRLTYLLIIVFAFVFADSLSAQNQAYADSLLKILPSIKADTERVNTMWRIADVSRDSSIVKEYADKAIALAQKIDYKKGEGIAWAVLANFYARKQIDNVKAVRYYTESLKVRQEAGDKKGIAHSYLQLAIIDSKFKNYEKALALLRKALALNTEIGNAKSVSQDEQVIAQVFLAGEQWDSALFYFRKTMSGKNIPTPTVAMTYINLVSLFIGTDQLDSALLYVHKTDSVYDLLGNNYGKLWDKMSLGQIALKKGEIQMAVAYLEEVYDFGEKNNNGDLLLNVLPILIDAYRQNGNAVKGFKVQTEWIKLNDSLQNLDKANSILGMQVQLETEEKEKIDKLIADKTEAEHLADSNRMRLIIYSVSAILVLVLGISFFIFRNYREKKKVNEIISKQKEIVEEKQREIVDSINYAKRLQDAILPPEQLVKNYFPESFILYKPKAIVAGDFYWMEKSGNTVFIAAADCTGHGVPGAMVSVVCSNALNRAVKEFGLKETGQILDKVRELVLETFENSSDDVKDGMDISLVSFEFGVINSETKSTDQISPHSTLQTPNSFHWSGANNPLWYVAGNEMHLIKADKQPVGKQENSKAFTTHRVEIPKGGMIYLFTDGYADQFGGPKGKKFRYKQLEELLLSIAALSPVKQHDQLEKVFLDWKGDLEQIDDVCLIGIRI
ncbi:MAG: SpoIIE family protein phosphatase [Bacteroidia bacterium]